tara:strand:- start:54 stop:356 length:303 start_codon:yes stop_codon:yes gene_type:complete
MLRRVGGGIAHQRVVDAAIALLLPPTRSSVPASPPLLLLRGLLLQLTSGPPIARTPRRRRLRFALRRHAAANVGQETGVLARCLRLRSAPLLLLCFPAAQ